MKKICIIGFNQYGDPVDNGQSAKVRLYFDKLIAEGYDTTLIDLSFVHKKPILTLFKIRKSIKNNDVLILLLASNGAKILIPFVNHFNRKYKKKIIYSLIGTSILHLVLDRLNPEQINAFLNQKQYGIIKYNKYWNKQLSKLDYILPETNCISDAFKGYFKLDNVFTLTNFRNDEEKNLEVCSKKNSFVFYSRIASIKGIFVLFEAIKRCREKGYFPKLDIYGPLQLNDLEKKQFDDFLDKDIVYQRTIKFNEVINVLRPYKCLIFPTLCSNEGVPGALVEGLIAGLPIISSKFPQLSSILDDENDVLTYKMYDVETLTSKIIAMMNDEKLLDLLKEKSIKNSKKFLYSYNKEALIKFIED